MQHIVPRLKIRSVPMVSMIAAIQAIGPGRLVSIQVSDQIRRATIRWFCEIRGCRDTGFGSASTVFPFNRNADDARQVVEDRDRQALGDSANVFHDNTSKPEGSPRVRTSHRLRHPFRLLRSSQSRDRSPMMTSPSYDPRQQYKGRYR